MKLLHGWCYASNGVGWGWGGVGMITFLALAHMVGATQHHVSRTCTHGGCYATSCFLHLHTWLVLRNIMFLALAHMVGATQHHGVGLGWGGDDNVPCTCTHGRCYATSCFVDVYVRRKLVCICTINGFLLPKFKHWCWPNHRHSKEQPQKAWLSDIGICSHVQIHCACQCIVTLAPKILWPTALLNAWTIMTFPKSSFYHTNRTFLTSIHVWMMDFSSINARVKKIVRAEHHSM